MLLTIQFPIADARPFIKNGTPRLSIDLSLNNYDNFVRYFGDVKKRIKGFPGSKEWASDAYYASAKRALTFPNLGQYYDGHEEIKPSMLLKPSFLSRRLFFDGTALARVEVGLSVDTQISLDKEQLKYVIKDYLTLPTKTLSFNNNNDKNRISSDLMTQGGRLAKLFLYATTPTTNHIDQPDINIHPVMGCNPVLFFEYKESDRSIFGKLLNKSILPDDVQRIDNGITNDVNLSYYIFKINQKSIVVWFIECNDKNKENVRLLKLCLLRLHAEQEVLKNIIFFMKKVIQNNPDNIEIDKLESYLSFSTQAIFKKKRFSIFQQSILNSFTTFQDGLTNDSTLTIIKNELPIFKDNLLNIKREQLNVFLCSLRNLYENLDEHISDESTREKVRLLIKKFIDISSDNISIKQNKNTLSITGQDILSLVKDVGIIAGTIKAILALLAF
jgi:hypothetical protein